MVALQETMMEVGKAQDTLKSYMRYWQMESLDADGHSGGVGDSMEPRKFCHNKAIFKDSIGTKLEKPETWILFYFLNLYAPFYDRRSF